MIIFFHLFWILIMIDYLLALSCLTSLRINEVNSQDWWWYYYLLSCYIGWLLLPCHLLSYFALRHKMDFTVKTNSRPIYIYMCVCVCVCVSLQDSASVGSFSKLGHLTLAAQNLLPTPISLSFFPEARCWLVRELMWVWGCQLRLWLRVCESGQRCQCGWVRGFGWVRRLCLSQVDKFLSESDPMPSPSKDAQKVWKLTAFRTVNVGCTSRAGNEQWGRRTLNRIPLNTKGSKAAIFCISNNFLNSISFIQHNWWNNKSITSRESPVIIWKVKLSFLYKYK